MPRRSAKPVAATTSSSPPPAKRGRRNAKSTDSASTTSKGKNESIVAKSMAKSAKSKKSSSSAKSCGAVVDSECPLVGQANVYSNGEEIYDAMLNQTNVQNNNNKYYILQILVERDGKYVLWFRWGRVGYKGQNKLTRYGTNVAGAVKEFESKFAAKTGNSWQERDDFEKVDGKYDMVKVDYSITQDGEGDEENEESLSVKAKKEAIDVESKLSAAIQKLVELICDVKAMQRACVELDFDTKQAPLGKLTPEQISSGYAALKTIEELIDKKTYGRQLVQACNDYYTRIPHKFGMRTPPLINSDIALRNELQLMEALADIEVAMRTLRHADEDKQLGVPVHPIDRHYDAMRCSLTALDRSHEQYSLIDAYVQNTHAPTHMSYKMKVRNIFDCQKAFVDNEGYDKAYANKLGNRRLLWHGSRLGNWYGILSQGLRIAPPEAPSTGYMFGKGVYFADMSSKSANYCFATRSHPVGLLLLCDVALGKTWDLVEADHKCDVKIKKKEFDSVKGLGMMEPDKQHDKSISEEDNSSYIIPGGKCVKTEVSNPDGYTLQYNEYIVYEQKVINLKYLVEVEFQFV